jgi:hypothetical protein
MNIRKTIAGMAVLVALGMMVGGFFRTYKVYDKKDDAFAEFGMATFSRVNDRQLVEDATFTGVTRDGEKLFSTYDRTVPRGKKACPT